MTDSQIFNQFNAVIFNNFSTSSKIEGRSVVGGESNFEIHGESAASSFGALSVYGNVTASGAIFNVKNGDNIAIAGTNNANFNLNTGEGVYTGSTNSGTLTVNGGAAA